MSDETLEQEVELNVAMFVGHAVECEDLAKLYRARAGQVWTQGGSEHEAIARYLRDILASELEERARGYRQKMKDERSRLDTVEPAG